MSNVFNKRHYQDGSFKTYQKAKLLKVHLVSVLWIEAVRKSMCRVPEQNYPALGNSNSNANASFLCQVSYLYFGKNLGNYNFHSTAISERLC